MSTQNMSTIQLPDDAISCGYRQVGAFEYAQVFSSVSANFKGTEQEFAAAGKAYRYIQTSPYTRVVVQ